MVGSSFNGLARNRRKNVIWTNDDPAHWRLMRSLSHNELKIIIIVTSGWQLFYVVVNLLRGWRHQACQLLHDGDVGNFEYFGWRSFVASVKSNSVTKLTPTASFDSPYPVQWGTCIKASSEIFPYQEELGVDSTIASEFIKMNPKRNWHVVYSQVKLNTNRKWHDISQNKLITIDRFGKVKCNILIYALL